jgi:hypothetical protein
MMVHVSSDHIEADLARVELLDSDAWRVPLFDRNDRYSRESGLRVLV